MPHAEIAAPEYGHFSVSCSINQTERGTVMKPAVREQNN
jgi:hypothetical protein